MSNCGWGGKEPSQTFCEEKHGDCNWFLNPSWLQHCFHSAKIYQSVHWWKRPISVCILLANRWLGDTIPKKNNKKKFIVKLMKFLTITGEIKYSCLMLKNYSIKWRLRPGKFSDDLKISHPNKCFPKSLPWDSKLLQWKDTGEAEWSHTPRRHTVLSLPGFTSRWPH